MIGKMTLGMLVAAAFATPVLAAPADTAAAVRLQEVAAQVAPQDGGAMIELAAAYQRAGRIADANRALRRALVLDNTMLETPTGDAVWSHEVARGALPQEVASTSR